MLLCLARVYCCVTFYILIQIQLYAAANVGVWAGVGAFLGMAAPAPAEPRNQNEYGAEDLIKQY